MVQYLDNNNSGFAMWNANKSATRKRSGLGILWWFLIFMVSWWAFGTIFGDKPKTDVLSETDVIEQDVSAVPLNKIASDKINADVRGLRVSNIELNEFPDGAENVKLLSGEKDFIEIGLNANGTIAPVADTVWNNVGDKYTWRNSDGVEFNRVVSVSDYVITINDEIKNNSDRDFSFSPYVRIRRNNDHVTSAGVYTGAVALVNGDVEHNDWRAIAKKPRAYTTTNGFAGFADQYWETVVKIDTPDQTIRAQKNGDTYGIETTARPVMVSAGDAKNVITHIFAGPRDGRILRDVERNISGIEKTVDYGWFWFLAMPMLWLINTINAFVMNYGIAIIIMTILLRLAMWPLTRKSYTSMAAMQKMQPEMQRIQKLYANDKQRMQLEMMKLYQTHKTSPMSGCLPMLIQIPIFFALYKALLISVQMRNAHFLWISDLAVMDPYFILPILMGLSMWLQQRLQSGATKSSDKNDVAAQTQRAMRWMPIIFTVMFAWMPAGLVLYWTVSNLFGIVQMYIIKRKMK